MKYKESYYNLEIDNDNNDRVLVFNTVTGALSWFNSENYDTFHNKENIDEKSLLKDIINLGFVVRQDRNELAWIKYQNRMTSYNNNPDYLHFVVTPTMACNYKCVYCFEKNYTCNKIMDERTMEATYNFIISKIKEFRPNKGFNIQWFGGEPLLAMNIIEKLSNKLIEYADENNLKYLSYIVTNGYFLTKENTDKLHQLRVTGAQITLDGMKEKYDELKKCPDDAFDKVVENIKYAQYKVGVNIRVNVNNKNKDDIKNLIRYLTKENGIKSKIYIADIRNYCEQTKDDIDSIEYEECREDIINYAKKLGIDNLQTDLPKRKYSSCEATTTKSYVIGPTGNIYRCTHLLDREGMESGNVFDGYEVKDVDLLFFDYKLPEKCNKCKIMPMCMGGCICDRYIDNLEFDCEERLMNLKYEVKQSLINKK